MKPAKIFHQYIWIINTLRAYRKLALGRKKRVFFFFVLLLVTLQR